MKRVIWGLFLVGLGVLFLLERAGLVEPLVAWWPIILVIVGITHLVERRPGGAILFFLLGAWFFAVSWGWHGMTYGNSWAMVLVAIGAGIIVKALTGEESRRHGSTSPGGGTGTPDAGVRS